MWDRSKYKVLKDGRIWSVTKGKYLKPMKNSCGYLQVYLRCVDGKTRWFRIHRLVAQEYIPNPNNLPEVNHKSEDKTLNTVEDLEWCDRKYNLNYGLRLKKIKANVEPKLKLNKEKEVYQFTLDGDVVGIYNTAKEAAESTNFKYSSISRCLLGKRKTYKKYLWKYVYKK